jgi:hypothetical protein
MLAGSEGLMIISKEAASAILDAIEKTGNK